MNIKKIDLCTRVSKKIKGSKINNLKPILDTFLDEILNALSDGQRIEIRGFGCFKTKIRKKKVGRNPKTGIEVTIPTTTVPIFKFSREAQNLFNQKVLKNARSAKKEERKKEVTPDLKSTVAMTEAPTLIPIKKHVTPQKSAETFSPV